MGKIDLNNYEAFLLDYFEGNLSEDLVIELKAFAIANPGLDIDLEDSDLPVFTKDEIKLDSKNDLLKTSDNIPFENLLNYLEGNLSITEKIKLENILSSDTELAKEMEMLKKTVLSADEQEVFDSKKILIKNDDQFVLNNRVLLYFENELNPEERNAFEKELSLNKGLQKELALVQKTKLETDASVVYPNKNELKKEGRVIALFSFRMAVAAALLVVLGAAVLFAFYNSGKESIEKNIAKKVETHSNPGKNINNNNTEILAAQNSSFVAERVVSKENKKKKLYNYGVSVKTVSASVANQHTIEATPRIENNEAKNDSIALVNNEIKNSSNSEPLNEGPVTRYTDINTLAVVKDIEEDAEIIDKPAKTGFWKRAVRLAQQANGLGLKAVKGDEKENENYSISFNSFSVEKK
ncbi:MAG: hypothetical protein ACXVNM_06915 [Bacteroidia bacterium]